MEFIECSTASAILAIAFATLSASLGVLLLRARRRPVKEPVLDRTAEDLLHDLLTRGQAILRVEVIDPTNLLLRSPRR